MDPASRTRLIALAVLLAISVPLIVIASGGGSEDSGGVEDGIRIEPSNLGVPEIVIYLEDPDLNTPETSGGAESVAIECMDRGGAVVFSGRENWPFSDTDGGIFDPHVHVRVDQAILGLIDRCRLKGTDPALEGGRPKRR